MTSCPAETAWLSARRLARSLLVLAAVGAVLTELRVFGNPANLLLGVGLLAGRTAHVALARRLRASWAWGAVRCF